MTTIEGRLREGDAAAPWRAPPALPMVAAALFLFGGIGPNGLLAAAAIAVFLIGSLLLWRPGQSPILLFVFGLQWLQASAKVFHANWLGVDIDQMMSFGGDVRLATLLSLGALLALAIGMRLAIGSQRSVHAVPPAGMPTHGVNWILLYGTAAVLALVAQRVSGYVPGLTQPLLALQVWKWACYWALTYVAFSSREVSRPVWAAVFVFELVLGLGDYFSEFKTVLIITLLALMASGVRTTVGRWAGLAAITLLLGTMTLVWTAIKIDYRDFVSGGERVQAVTVDFGDRIGKLSELTVALDRDALLSARDRLFERVAYVDFFAAVLQMVPDQMPHEGGAIWIDAITRPFMPRLLFPEKQIIDDSARTNHYTGLGVYGADQGTSISIGYIGESYIDFGKTGMMFVILAFGILMGWIYRRLTTSPMLRPQLAMGLATAILYQAAFLDSSITKTLGGIAVALLVNAIVAKFLVNRFPQLGGAA